MVIWDTGQYEVLPYQVEETAPETETDGTSDASESIPDAPSPFHHEMAGSEKLQEAFRHVCLLFPYCMILPLALKFSFVYTFLLLSRGRFDCDYTGPVYRITTRLPYALIGNPTLRLALVYLEGGVETRERNLLDHRPRHRRRHPLRGSRIGHHHDHIAKQQQPSLSLEANTAMSKEKNPRQTPTMRRSM